MPLTSPQANIDQAPKSENGVKKRFLKNGKTKWTATVWYENKYYCSKTFATESLASSYYTTNLKNAIRGTLSTAANRKADQSLAELLAKSMKAWATEFGEAPAGLELCKTRRDLIKQVGNLLEKRPLSDFSGVQGALLIAELQEDWKNDRRPRSKIKIPQKTDPLADNTVRLRMTGLNQLILFAKSRVMVKSVTAFVMPDMETVHKYRLPPAHGNKRKRVPSDEELVRLLRAVGADSEFGEFLRAIDDTGSRLSEVRELTGAQLNVLRDGELIIGGSFSLIMHKTEDHVGERTVPICAYAADILARRKQTHGNGLLFPGLGSLENVLDAFDEAKEDASITNLQMKDFRRAFINRNKSGVSTVDMMQIFGKSSLIEEDNSEGQRDTMAATGHQRVETMAGYNVIENARLSRVFTATSRWPRIAKALGITIEHDSVDVHGQASAAPALSKAARIAAAQRKMAQAAAELAALASE